MIWVVWCVLLLLFTVVSLIAGRLARDEDDELILHESLDHVRQEQAAIVARLHRVEPLKRMLMWLLLAVTLIVIGYYALDIYRHLQV
ncbi:MAG: hypothetical protein ACLGPM_08175 [Acidobacteriota bacterium]